MAGRATIPGSMAQHDVLLIALGGTAGLRAADDALAGLAAPRRRVRRDGARGRRARAAHVRAHRPRLGRAGAARGGGRAARRRGRARSSTRPSPPPCSGPSPGRSASTRRRPATGPAGTGSGSARSSAAASPPRRCCCRGARAGWPRRPSPHGPALVLPVPVERSGALGRARHRRDHLRRQPGEEGPRPRARRLARGAPPGRDARRRRPRGARRGRRPLRGHGPGRRLPRAAAARARVRHRAAPRGLRLAQLEALADGCALVTTAPAGPYAALPLARALDPRLVGDDLAAALRTALDDPAPGYAERAREALAPWTPRRGRRDRARAAAAGAARRRAVLTTPPPAAWRPSRRPR